MSSTTSKSYFEDQFKVWLNAFSENDRRQQLKDDSTAWGRITSILMVVVSLGLLISAMAVAIALTMP